MRKELFHLYIYYSFQWGVSVAALMLTALLINKAYVYTKNHILKVKNASGRSAARDY